MSLADEVAGELHSLPDSTMSKILSGLSHDLLNPVNAAVLQLRTLLRHPPEDGLSGPARGRVTAALQELRRITELVNDYVIINEPPFVQADPTDIAEVLRGALALVDTHCSVQLSVPHQLDKVAGDRRRLTQMFTHLLRNSTEALRDHESPQIDVTVSVNSESVIVTIRDNGGGVALNPVSTAFKPFVSTKPAGTGIGLTVVERVVRAHKGTVALESDETGTAVHVALPRVGPELSSPQSSESLPRPPEALSADTESSDD